MEKKKYDQKVIKYLEEEVRPILEPLLLSIEKEKPENQIDYAILWLKSYLGKSVLDSQNVEKNELQRLRKEIKKYRKKYKVIDEDLSISEEDDKMSDEEKSKVDEEIEKKVNNFKKNKKNFRTSVSAEVYGVYNKLENFKPKVFPKTEEQKQKLKERMKENFLFKNLDKEEQNTVIDAFEQRKVVKDELIIKEGDYGDCLYLVEEGKLDCTKVIKGKKTKLKIYESGDSFGELALLYNSPRAATIVSLEESLLWKLDRECFNVIVKDAAMRKRQKYEEQLKKVEILKTLDDYGISQICDALNVEEVNEGETIIKEGEEGNKFYILNKGEATATKNINGQEQKVFDYQPSSYFGELALLKNDKRAATITAKTNCSLLVLDRKAFKRLLGPLQEILQKNSELYTKYIK